MKDFTLYNPTKIEFGRGKENNIDQCSKEYNCRWELVIIHEGINN